MWKVCRVDAEEPLGGCGGCPGAKCWCSGSREVSMEMGGRVRPCWVRGREESRVVPRFSGVRY